MKIAFRVIFIFKMAANKIDKISIEIGDHSQFNDFVVGHFENGGLVKMILNASFIITNEFLTSKYS
jgi:hypothetical protein